MLEDQIEKLTLRVVSVGEKQDQTNRILGDILAVLRDGSTTPPEPVVAAKKMDLVADNDVEEAPVAEAQAADEPKAYTLDDVRAAYLPVMKTFGKDAAIGLVKEVAGPVEKMTDIPDHKFADVIQALDDHALQQEAA